MTVRTMSEGTSSTKTALSFLQKFCFDSEDEQSLSLHFVGSDETECSETLFFPQSFADHYGILLTHLFEKRVRIVHFLFVGPNMNFQLAEKAFSFSFLNSSWPDRLDPLTVHVSAQSVCYHELPASVFREDTLLFVMMFNAGIWGYPAWAPTLLFLKVLSRHTRRSPRSSDLNEDVDLKPIGPVCLVTAYTLPEAEEDFDEIEKLFAPGSPHTEATAETSARLVWVWECELNAQRCDKPISKRTQPTGSDSVYLSNHYWSCFQFISA